MFSIEEVADMFNNKIRTTNDHIDRIRLVLPNFAPNGMLNYAELGFYSAFYANMTKFNDSKKALEYLSSRGNNISASFSIIESTIEFTKANIKN
ncbi:hypothetical protein [Lysinibacillus sphaericus]|uniref:hypothetical protein n=1 Tax=Lysinibacillus sphaericus TaxID=1421 RepID=UPI00056C0485|nr:hypothetical protein [Lysinibacillus sphaericus]